MTIDLWMAPIHVHKYPEAFARGACERAYHQIDDNMSDSGITEASFDLFAVQTGMLDHSVYMEEDSKGKAKFGIQG